MSTQPPKREDDPKGALAAFSAAALSAAGAIAVIGLVGIVLSGLIHPEAVRRVVESITAIIFAIGLVQVVWDAWLHTRLTAAFLQVVQRGQSEATKVLTQRFKISFSKPSS